MKKRVKLLLRNLFVNNAVFIFFKPLIYFVSRLQNARNNFVSASGDAELNLQAGKIFKNNIVCNGPFKGIILDSKMGLASANYAKLLGSYEKEIHPFIDRLLQKKYNEVINIGCDDGYYAMGFAKRMPGVIVNAYDINEDALENARELAVKNGLQENIRFYAAYGPADIYKLNPARRYLFIVDCEGDENNIFNAQNAAHLQNSDLIIEMHIDMHPHLEDDFKKLFGATHTIELVNSLDDHLKARQYDYPELEGLSYKMRRFITKERAIFMQWMLIEAKQVC